MGEKVGAAVFAGERVGDRVENPTGLAQDPLLMSGWEHIELAHTAPGSQHCELIVQGVAGLFDVMQLLVR